MSPPKLDTTVSIRDIITVLAIAITGVISFQVVTGRVDALEKSDARQEQRLTKLEEAQTALFNKVSDIAADVRFLRRDVEAEQKRREAGK